MTKDLFVGDVHGDLKLVRFLVNNFSTHRLRFVGDVLDSFVYTPGEQITALGLILDYVENKGGELLVGNHEASYLNPQLWRATGFNTITAVLFQPLKARYQRLAVWYAYDAQRMLLFTHAGVTKSLWDAEGLTFENLDARLTDWVRNADVSPLMDVGATRRGRADVGGPMWCDWNTEFEPVPGLTQIMGHTLALADDDKTNGVRVMGTNYNIDCLQRQYEFLEHDLQTGEFKVIGIPEAYVKQ